jgi:uncharacterized protein (TIGR01777 family)
MRILIAGASGFIGTALRKALEADGHSCVVLVRREPQQNEARWQPAAGFIDTENVGPIDAAINLSGEGIFGRWTSTKKSGILGSRVDSTRTLATAIAAFNPLPTVFVSASGANYYGDRGDEELSEESGIGKGFLAEVCAQWESATQPAADAGIRVVNPRMGIVLGNGASLKKMLTPFRLGLGARLGNGSQYMSWIAVDDAISAYKCVLENNISGPVNFTSPNPVRNSEFTKVLARVLKRPAFLAVPAFVLRAILGEAADELLLSSVRVTRSRLEETGFKFAYPNLEEALRKVT